MARPAACTKSGAARGMSPSAYRRHGAGMQIAYSIISSPFGRLLVGTTVNGVCAVKLGDSDAELARALREEYHAADIGEGEPARAEWVRAIVAHLEGESARAGPADRRAGHRVPVEGVARAPGDSVRSDPSLR